jgi:hypothetical protein
VRQQNPGQLLEQIFCKEFPVFPVFPVFPSDLFGGFRQRRVANIAGIPPRASTARPPVSRERAAVAIEPST